MLFDMWELSSQLAPGKPQLGPGLNAGGGGRGRRLLRGVCGQAAIDEKGRGLGARGWMQMRVGMLQPFFTQRKQTHPQNNEAGGVGVGG